MRKRIFNGGFPPERDSLCRQHKECVADVIEVNSESKCEWKKEYAIGTDS